jgi:uncharacterized membrane protein YgcG
VFVAPTAAFEVCSAARERAGLRGGVVDMAVRRGGDGRGRGRLGGRGARSGVVAGGGSDDGT